MQVFLYTDVLNLHVNSNMPNNDNNTFSDKCCVLPGTAMGKATCRGELGFPFNGLAKKEVWVSDLLYIYGVCVNAQEREGVQMDVIFRTSPLYSYLIQILIVDKEHNCN